MAEKGIDWLPVVRAQKLEIDRLKKLVEILKEQAKILKGGVVE